MNILLTNDDGIRASGIAVLAETLASIHNLTIVAPDRERSAVSHGLTIHTPLFVTKTMVNNLAAHAVSGTPADCVKLGIDTLTSNRPDLVVSGINRGANTGLNVFYSGTVAAAMEATFVGIPAIAVSIGSFQPADYGCCARFVARLIDTLQNSRLPDHVMLNINVPDLPETDIKGTRLTYQSRSRLRDCYVCRETPSGTPYYWLDGDHPEQKVDINSDEYALSNGWISVTPLTGDWNVSKSDVGEINQWIRLSGLREKHCLLL